MKLPTPDELREDVNRAIANWNGVHVPDEEFHDWLDILMFAFDEAFKWHEDAHKEVMAAHEAGDEDAERKWYWAWDMRIEPVRDANNRIWAYIGEENDKLAEGE